MKKKIITLFLFCAVVVGGLFSTYSVAHAATVPFGGLILFTKRCTCPVPGFLVVVSGPVGGNFLYVPSFTELFANYGILFLDNWVLGLHTGTPVGCGNWDEGYCAHKIPTRGIMTIVGTS